jgi:CRP-like cAMP-binding protein
VGSKTALRKLEAATAALTQSPTDLSAWLEICRALCAAGKNEQARRAFRDLGEAASTVGQVALAVACAIWLRDSGAPQEATALLDSIAATHCAGSRRIDSEMRPRPPAPPPAESRGETEAGQLDAKTIDQAIELAVGAMRAAARRAEEVGKEKLAPTPLVSVLSRGDFQKMCSVMRAAEHAKGAVIIEEGQSANELYWIARGGAEVSRGEHRLGELRADSFFGEIALVGAARRTARVTAARDTWLLEIPARSLEEIAAHAPNLAEELAVYARARLLSTVMRTSELFSRLSAQERAQLLPRFETQVFGAGSEVLKRGEAGSGLYVVVSGRCEVRQEAVVTPLGVGDGVGEMSLLSRGPAMADVIATERTVMLCLPRAKFDEFALEHPALLAEVYKLAVQREQSNRNEIIHDASDLIV